MENQRIMQRSIGHLASIGLLTALTFSSCAPVLHVREARKSTPTTYAGSTDTTDAANVRWKQFFKDPNLVSLIDSALANNQELNITLQEIAIANNEVRARKGEYLPFVGLGAGAGVEKVGRYTSQGANDANTDIDEGKEFPEPLPDFMVGAYASWEVDIWSKLRNAKKSAVMRYLATVEGKNFMVTHLVAEIANSYYELMALDNQLEILRSNIGIQQDALEIIKLEKQSAKVTELAVRRFEAEVLKNQSLQFIIQQRIIETENRINLLLGRYPQPIQRNTQGFASLVPDTIYAGLPSQLLAYRPDIRKAELELEAAKLDVKVARARFYPSLDISAAIGLRAFNPDYLIKTPESMLYSMVGELAMPLINRNAIKADYSSASAKQMQAVYAYERTVLGGYIEVVNQLSNINNLHRSYALRSQQVDALYSSITISGNLFRSARADYMEVLLTQRDAFEARSELIETKLQQMNAMVNVYQALGGGWK